MTLFNTPARILQISGKENLDRIFRRLNVDPYGIRIMLPKAINYLIKLESLSGIEANILKQEMLSLGGDAALPRQALTAGNKKTDCLMIGTLAQFIRLNEKLSKQPFGLAKLAAYLSDILNNYNRGDFVLKLRAGDFKIAGSVKIMGIVNLTPDSFSQDGLFKAKIGRWENQHLDYAVEYAQKLVKDGADILDIGGESSRPDSRPVPLKEELLRTIPVIKKLAKKIKVPISIDTYKPEVARQALDNGASLVNDISGLKNLKMAKFIARDKAGLVIMHMQGKPCNMQKNPHYRSVTGDIIRFLDRALKRAQDAGIDREKIIIDPGIGFGKTLEHNLKILQNLDEFKILGRPILVGTSRKSFIGKILNAGPEKRLAGTIASCVLALRNGASILRVHDVKEVARALKVAEAILNQSGD